MNDSERVLISAKEACRRLSIGRTRLYQLIRAQLIKTVRIGPRGIRVPVSEIERFVREGLES